MSTPHGATLAEQLAGIPVITDADVLARVAAIIEPEARRERVLWLFFLNPDGTQAPVIVPVHDLPEVPGEDGAEVPFHFLRHFYGTDATDVMDLSFIITVCRDGTTELTGSDRQWLRALQSGIEEYAAPVRMLCLATPDGIRELGPVTPAP